MLVEPDDGTMRDYLDFMAWFPIPALFDDKGDEPDKANEPNEPDKTISQMSPMGLIGQ